MVFRVIQSLSKENVKLIHHFNLAVTKCSTFAPCLQLGAIATVTCFRSAHSTVFVEQSLLNLHRRKKTNIVWIFHLLFHSAPSLTRNDSTAATTEKHGGTVEKREYSSLPPGAETFFVHWKPMQRDATDCSSFDLRS